MAPSSSSATSSESRKGLFLEIGLPGNQKADRMNWWGRQEERGYKPGGSPEVRVAPSVSHPVCHTQYWFLHLKQLFAPGVTWRPPSVFISVSCTQCGLLWVARTQYGSFEFPAPSVAYFKLLEPSMVYFGRSHPLWLTLSCPHPVWSIWLARTQYGLFEFPAPSVAYLKLLEPSMVYFGRSHPVWFILVARTHCGRIGCKDPNQAILGAGIPNKPYWVQGSQSSHTGCDNSLKSHIGCRDPKSSHTGC